MSILPQKVFYAEALRSHLGSLATGVGLGTIFRNSGIARFVQGGVKKPSVVQTNRATLACHTRRTLRAFTRRSCCRSPRRRPGRGN